MCRFYGNIACVTSISFLADTYLAPNSSALWLHWLLSCNLMLRYPCGICVFLHVKTELTFKLSFFVTTEMTTCVCFVFFVGEGVSHQKPLAFFFLKERCIFQHFCQLLYTVFVNTYPFTVYTIYLKFFKCFCIGLTLLMSLIFFYDCTVKILEFLVLCNEVELDLNIGT